MSGRTIFLIVAAFLGYNILVYGPPELKFLAFAGLVLFASWPSEALADEDFESETSGASETSGEAQTWLN